MSRLPVAVLTFGLAVAAAPGSAVAQQSAMGQQNEPSPTPEELRAELDSLRPLLADAKRDLDARVARIDAARRIAAEEEASIDTLYVGGARVLTPSHQATATEAVFNEVWEETFATLGASPALARTTITFQQGLGDPAPIHVEGDAHEMVVPAWRTSAQVKRDIRGALSQAMSHDVKGTPFGGWLVGDAFAPDGMDATYRRVAVTRSRATRACLGGDPKACGAAMGLGTTRDVQQLREWYTPEERRSLVADRYRAPSRRFGAIRARCVEREDYGACNDLLDDFRQDWAPLGPDVRESLVAHALEVGAPGGWERILEDPEMTPIEALERASGQPVDDLLSGWRKRLVESRPRGFEPLVPSSGRTLAWSLFFAALALRSTRWRLG